MAKVLGIDLGTTNSVMSYVEGGVPVILESAEGSRLTPSVVAINPKTSERYVGLAAKRQGIVNPEHTVFSAKRLMGRKIDDPVVVEDIKRIPYKIEKADNGDAHVFMGDKTYSPPEISSMILQKMKTDAEAKLGETITEAVVTVPAYFNDAQRQATKDAGKVAGLDVLRIINEPTAAALAYGMDKHGEATIAVFDLGGGTFDITVLRLGDGVFEVLSTAGDTHLGGDDFDQKAMEWLVQEFKQETAIDLSTDRMALQRLKEAAEKAKVELSSVTQTEINLPFVSADSAGPKHLVRTLTRAQLEQMTEDLLARVDGPCNQAIKDAGISVSDINEVIMVGGMTRMPAVIERVKATFKQDPNHSVNPDEAVAAGAALQAAVLKGDVQDILLLDVTPLTMGLETEGGVSHALITRNTTIPTSKSEVFTTASENQPSVEIHVLQGERPMAADNRSVGKFTLDGILPAQRGTPKIEVTFDIDANGILSVSAKDQATGKEQKIIIESSSGLSKEEIEQMVTDAEQHASEDQERKEEVDLRNAASQLSFSAKKLLEDQAEHIPEELKTEIQTKGEALSAGAQTEDVAILRTMMEELNTLMQKVGEAVYQQAGGPGEGEPGAEGAPGEGNDEDKPDDTVEGEFREV